MLGELKYNTPLISTMDIVNGLDMNFIFKKRGISPETDQLRQERNRILKPCKTRIVERGTENERIQEYRPSQEGRKQIERISILIYYRFFDFCEKIGRGIPRKRERIVAKPTFR